MFVYFGRAGFSVLLGPFSSCGEQGWLCSPVHGLPTAEASLAAEHGLQGAQAQQLQCLGYLLRGMWDLPGQGPDPCFLPWQLDSLPLSDQGSPCGYILDGTVYNTKVFLGGWVQFIYFFLLLLVLLVSYLRIHCVFVQSLSHIWLFATPWTAARQAYLASTISWSLLKLRIHLPTAESHKDLLLVFFFFLDVVYHWL